MKKNSRKVARLTDAHYEAMRAVTNGADVFSYVTARLLREVEATKPAFITVTDAMGDYNPVGQLPYFGAILTGKGKDALKARRAKAGVS